MVVLNALSIGCHTADGDLTLAVCEKLCRRGLIRKDNKGDNTPRNRESSKDDENVHPLLETGCDMSDCVTNQSAEHCCNAISAIIRFKSKWLFGCCIPHGHYQDEARIDSGLHRSQEEAVCRNSAKTGTCWCRNEDYTPDDCSDGEEFANP